MAISVAGSVFDTSGVKITTGLSVGLRVNGGTENLVTSDGSGDFSFASITASAGDTLTLYINGETQKANAVTITDGTTNITGVVLRDNRITLRSDNGAASINNTDIGAWDNDDDATDMLFTANAGLLTIETQREFEVVSGETFAPGGNVTLTAGTTSEIFIRGTWVAADGETIDCAGNFDCLGTYTRATTDKLILRDRAAGEQSTDIDWGTNTFTEIEFVATLKGDVFDMSGTCTVKGQLTFTRGKLKGSGAVINAEGNVEVGVDCDSSNSSTPKIAITGTGAQTINGTANDGNELPNFEINKPAGTLTITGKLGFGQDYTHIAGTVNPGTSTVVFASSGSPGTQLVTMNGTAFNNLEMDGDSDADTMQLQDDMVLNGNLNFTKGIIDLQNFKLKVAGDWDDDGVGTVITVGGSSTLEFNGTGVQSANLAGKTFDTILVSNTAAIVTFDTNGWTCANLKVNDNVSVTFEDAQTFLATADFTFSGTGGGGVTFRSTLDGTTYTLRLQTGGTQAVMFVDVKDADSSGGESITNIGGTDSGNNTNWTFPGVGVATDSVNEAHGTVIMQVIPLFDGADIPGEQVIWEISDGTSNNVLRLRFSTSGEFVWEIRSGGAAQATITSTTLAIRNKKIIVAGVWDTNDARLLIDGKSEGTPDTVVTVPAQLFSPISIGKSDADTLQAFCHLSRHLVSDEALSDRAIANIVKQLRG